MLSFLLLLIQIIPFFFKKKKKSGLLISHALPICKIRTRHTVSIHEFRIANEKISPLLRSLFQPEHDGGGEGGKIIAMQQHHTTIRSLSFFLGEQFWFELLSLLLRRNFCGKPHSWQLFSFLLPLLPPLTFFWYVQHSPPSFTCEIDCVYLRPSPSPLLYMVGRRRSLGNINWMPSPPRDGRGIYCWLLFLHTNSAIDARAKVGSVRKRRKKSLLSLSLPFFSFFLPFLFFRSCRQFSCGLSKSCQLRLKKGGGRKERGKSGGNVLLSVDLRADSCIGEG